jgi:hypothetical protein
MMFNNIRNSRFSRYLWGFMALYLLNISVDMADPFPRFVPEDLSFNDQESIVEIVVEQLLGYEDAFEEFDDADTSDHNSKTPVKIDLVPPFQGQFYHDYNWKKGPRAFINFQGQGPSKGFFLLVTPPPKV